MIQNFNTENIVAVILGAGLSERMNGYPKPLIKFKGKYLTEYIYGNLINLLFEHIIFVAGHKSETVVKHLNFLKKIKFVTNENYRHGQFSSLKCGLKYIKNNNIKFEYILILLCDTPFIKLDTYLKLLNSLEENKIIIPSYNYQAGHPVIINKSIFDIMLNASDNSISKEIINSKKESIKYIEVDDENILKDFDNKKDLDGQNWKFEELG
ncbi:nucleotidyltransferase family protein [Candidatus Dependentiae bacterium]|nr:nucleotidyltransferase family protein [Candidatus Dependentiae bacterium]